VTASVPAPAPQQRIGPILATLLLATLSFALLQTMVAPALPSIAEEFSTSTTGASWTLTGFLLSASVFTPLIGKLGDLFGKGRTLTIVLVVFAAGSVVCAIAPSIEVLVLGRVIQGVAGGVFPLSFGIIRDTFPSDRVPVGIGVLSAMFGIGGGIGLPLSGVIIDNADLHWIFLVGLLALPAAFVAARAIPPSPRREVPRIDWLGAVVLSAGLVSLLYGVTKANDWGWGSGRTLGLILGGLALLGLWAAVERRVGDPLVDLRVLSRRAVATTNLVGLLIGFAMFSSFLLIPAFAQTPAQAGYGFGTTVTGAGLLMVPSSVTMLIAGPLGGWLGPRIGFRAVLALGAFLSTVSFVVLAMAHAEEWQFVVAGLLLGAGIAFAFASMINLIVGNVDQRDVGVATGINTITRTVGGAFGSAVAAAIVTAHLLPGTPIPAESGYTTAFWIAAGGGLAALFVTMFIPDPRGQRAAAVAGGGGAPAGPAPAPGTAVAEDRRPVPVGAVAARDQG
jgi:EmrB/QacA subfamily drug resistance transporter